jgi:hypothetical protein
MNSMLSNITQQFLEPNATAPQWMIDFVDFRRRLFLQTFEPIVVTMLGPVEEEEDAAYREVYQSQYMSSLEHIDENHRRLGFLPKYIYNEDNTDNSYRASTSMTFATLFVLFITLSCVFLIFLSCFYHNQKTSPLFISPRRHRLPKLVPPPLPVDGYLSWVKVCLFMSDEEIINRVGYDSLIFLRFHRLAVRCIVKMSVFSFIVILPLNYTGSGNASGQDMKSYVGMIFVTDFMRFTMANVRAGSPRLWVHCFAAYLLTAIVVRELLVEYETFNSIRHRYLLSREPHLRTVLVTNIPRHLRSSQKITNYFKHVYPNAVRSVFMCQNITDLERLVKQRTTILSRLEKELLILCRTEKKKLYEPSVWRQCFSALSNRFEDCGVTEGTQERLVSLYSQLEEFNNEIEREQRRRRRVMSMLDRLDAGDGANDIDYVLASPFMTDDPSQRRILGLAPNTYQAPPENRHPAAIPEGDEANDDEDEGEEISPNYSPLPDRTIASQLRARSPAAVGVEPDGLHKYDDYDDGRSKKRGKPISKAKHAISRRYGRFKKEITFLGRPILSAAEVESEGKIEDHINEVTDKAFVVMRTFTAATIAIQSMHSSKPGSMQVVTAPEPRDVLWENIYVSKGAHRTRSILGEFLVYLIICFYVVPIAIVSLLVSEKAIISSSPRLAQLHRASAFFSAFIQMVQPLCIVGLQQLQPPLFMAIGKMEGITSFSEIQMRAFSRYFFFQVLNVFLVTTIAGTIFDTIALIVENPESAFVRLGNSLPRMSSFFITFVTIKTFLGLGMEMVRLMALVQAGIRHFLFPSATLRTRRTPILGMRCIDDPGWFPFHKILAQDMLVVVISVVFAVVAPLVLLPCALFCLFSRIMWTHHHMFVYESVFESGGMFWPKIFRRFVFGLVIAQMTITGQFILKGARHQAYAIMFLIFLTYMFLRSTRARYDATSSTLPLEVATVMDISLRQEEAHAQGMSGPDAMGSPRTRSDPGALIGSHDPFRKAFLQPALRAIPRARPEQPFPIAQLGKNEDFQVDKGSGSEDTDEAWQDSSATVRLKSMNQQDRRLINRWWDDQLQRAGDQNWLWILTGEECGTLTISGPSMVDAELHASLTENRSFV